MRVRRLIALLFTVSLVVAACSSGDRDVELLEGDRATDGLAMELVQQEGAVDPDVDALISQTAAQVDMTRGALDTLLDELAADCSANDNALNRTSADLSERTFIAPGDLRCARLAEASLENAHIQDVDLSGASLAGANLRNARLRIVAVGVDFTGADLTGADLTGSDLTGATFTSATLVSSKLSGLVTSTEPLSQMTVGGLTGASFTGARVGCNELEASPLIELTGVIFDDGCTAADVDGYIDMTLSGNLLGAKLDGFSFARVHLLAKDFRAASMLSASIADFGVLPNQMMFVSADLTGADLSNNTIDQANFAGATMTAASLAGSTIDDSWFSRADLTSTNFSSVLSNHNDYRAAVVTGTDFSGATLSWDDFSGAAFTAPIVDGVVVEAVVCDGTAGPDTDNGNSVRNFGLCTVGTDLVF